MNDEELSKKARELAGALEPVVGQVYFSPECHRAYEELGFGPSPGDMEGVAMPEMESYFCSRGSLMGQVPGSLIAAAFAVFNHEHVERIVARGWQKTDATTIGRARDDGAVAQLRRLVGAQPDGAEEARRLLARADEAVEPYGKPLYAGAASQPRFDDPLADCWRLGDRLREYRGDAHTASWTTEGFDACQIGMISELYWGLPSRSYARTRMWSDEQFDAAEAELEARGLMADHQLTDEGRAAREALEVSTDRQCRPVVEALGDDLGRLVAILEPWGEAVRDGYGYMRSGPHDLAEALGR